MFLRYVKYPHLEWRTFALRRWICEHLFSNWGSDGHRWVFTGERNPYQHNDGYFKKTCARCGDEGWYLDRNRFEADFQARRKLRKERVT